MGFDKDIAERLLVACHRHCCICNRFAGTKMEIHHIRPKYLDGEDTEENGIPLCFNCHAEVGSYNPKHPKGRRFTESELRKHKDQWFEICKNPPWGSASNIPQSISQAPWKVPHRLNPNFTGRGDEMTQLQKLLTGKDRVVINQVSGISGMGGIGKTQLAVEYVHKFKGEYPGGVLWVQAESSVLEEYGMLGDELGLDLPETLEVRKQCSEVRRKLESLNDTVLLVLDNLDKKEDYGTIKEYLPTTGAYHILITSRRKDLIPGAGIPLDVLPEDEALKLLLKESGCKNENGAGEGICKLLGCLPLALELAGKFIGKRRIGLAKYKERLEESGALDHGSLDGKGKQGAVDHIASLRATLTVNKELLEDTEVQPVLAALTCFAPESINPEILASVCGLEEESLKEVIAQLEDYSLIQVQADNRLSLHRLLREALISQLPDESINHARDNYIDKLTEWSKTCNDVTKLKVIKPEAPHLIEAADVANKLDIWPQSFELTIRLGTYYGNLGRFHEKLKRLKQLESVVNEKLSDDKSCLGLLVNNIGETYYTLGQYDQAIIYFEQSLPVTKEAYGKKHSNVASCLNNLGMAWASKGEYDKAIEYSEQALSILKEIYGERHPQVAIGLNNLGTAWVSKGGYDKAIEYFEQALSISKEIYGERHPQIAIGLNNLGTAWASKGGYDKAIQYYEQALSIDKEHFGERHPDVAVDLNNLGMAWASKGEVDKARKYYYQSYDIKLEFLGEDHPHTKLTKENMEALPPA